ncbi:MULTISPECIES: endolytic transglycosylase MltG [Streptomyces]|uniref:Endolytic murein transglycosylase n=1 Tax=Streptomyces ehimensis TaxID=68195 RepID=A0ABV9BK10_9ACTN
MTEYGRGSGSQPWHPEDPLYGDRGYAGQQYPQPHQAQQSQPPYAGQQDYGWDPSQNAGGPGPYDTNGHGEQYTGQHGGQQTGTYPNGGQQGYYEYDTGAHGYPDQHTGAHQMPMDQHTGQHQVPMDQHTGTHQMPMDQHTGAHQMPVNQHTGQHQMPQAPGEQHTGQQQVPQARTATADPVEEKISLFDDVDDRASAPALLDDDSDDGDEPARGRDRRGKGRAGKGKGREKKPKRRSGTACLLVAVVLVGGLGGAGYFAYDYWETHYGTAPDYEGEGTGQVQVEIPKGASLTEMGQVLEKAGVVKSVGAFTSAAAKKSIQPGTYTLHKEMSGASAVAMMTNSANFLTFAEGMRAAEIYSSIDKKLGLAAGTTKGVAKSQAKNLGLPEWANSDPDVKDPLEGFLFPSQYSAGKGTKPDDLLRQMVARAKQNYDAQDVVGKAASLGLKSPMQVVTLASLVQVEGKYKHDFDKISRVVYNRLKPDNKETYGLLDFDSTVNYAKSQSTLDVGAVSDLRKFKDPYNTYNIKGLPPGPISNPGLEALKSALQPADGPWYYFVSINENQTLFAVTNAEHNKNRQKYEQETKAKKAAAQ